MPNFFCNKKNNWKIGRRIFSPYYKVFCSIDNSCEHILKLSIEKNRFPVLRSESPSGKCAKLHTVAASNNRE